MIESALQIINAVGNTLTILLVIIGTLKVIARYTRWKWDDKIFDILDNFLYNIRDVFRR